MDKNLNLVTIRVLVYYLVTVVGLQLLLFYYPEARNYLPVGGIDRLAEISIFNPDNRGQGIGIKLQSPGKNWYYLNTGPFHY